MKKIFLVLIGIILIQKSFGTITHIGGHFDKPSTKTITIQYYASIINMIESRSTKQELPIDSRNNFRFEIETDIPLNFHLINGDNWLFINKYVAPGDSLWFEIQKGNVTEVTGRCEDCIGFMFEWENKFWSGKAVNEEFNSSARRLEPKEFIEYWNKRRTDQLNSFNKFFKGKALPSLFKEVMEDEINYSYAVAILQYSTKNVKSSNRLEDSVYLKFLEFIPVDNPNAITHRTYLHFLRELPANIYFAMTSDPRVENSDRNYIWLNQIHLRDSIAKKYFTGKSYELALYQILYEQIRTAERMKGQSYFESYYHTTDSIISQCASSFSDQTLYKRVSKKFHELKDTSKAAPDFVLKDIDGKQVRLSDFKGTVVYLDFWATNCAPCVAEIPDAKKLSERFKGKDVVFIYISLDHSSEKLKQFLNKNSFNGIQLNAPQGFASDIANLYEINAIPHYFLIDKAGNIVNADAPRPSSNPDKIIEKLVQQ